MKTLSVVATLLFASTFASADSLNCAYLANSAGAEPDGYAEQCAVSQSMPWVAPMLAPDGITDIGFTLDVRGQVGVPTRLANSLYTFTLGDFPTQTFVGVTQASIFAMDFSPEGTTLFGATGSAAATNPSTFGTVNPATGAFTVVGPLTGLAGGDSATGLTIDPLSGDAFFSAAGGTPASSRLYTLDLTTGALTVVGQMTAPTDPTGTLFIDIAMNCEGQLFAHNISDDALYSIDPTTGAGTLIGLHGLAANFAQGMDFDNSDGTLYAFIYTGSGTNRFGSFNLTTGAFSTLAQDNPLGEYEGAIPTQCSNDVIFANGFD